MLLVRGLSLPGAVTRVAVQQESAMNPRVYTMAKLACIELKCVTTVTFQCRHSSPHLSVIFLTNSTPLQSGVVLVCPGVVVVVPES